MRGTQSKFTDGSDGSRRSERPDRPDKPGGRGFTIDTRLLIVVFVALALVVIVVSSLMPDPSEPDPVAVPTDTAEPTRPSEDPTTTEPPSTDNPDPTDTAPPEEGNDDHGDEPAPAEAATAATKFVDAWLLRGDETERRDAMKPYATAGLVRSVAATDVNRLPDAERTGKPQEISSGTYQAAFRITLTNDDQVDVVVVFGDDDKWRASEINPAEVG